MKITGDLNNNMGSSKDKKPLEITYGVKRVWQHGDLDEDQGPLKKFKTEHNKTIQMKQLTFRNPLNPNGNKLVSNFII